MLTSFSFSRDIQWVTISRQAIHLISPTQKNVHKKREIQKCAGKRKRWEFFKASKYWILNIFIQKDEIEGIYNGATCGKDFQIRGLPVFRIRSRTWQAILLKLFLFKIGHKREKYWVFIASFFGPNILIITKSQNA